MKVEVSVSPDDGASLAAGVGLAVQLEVRATVSRVVVESVDGIEGTTRHASVEFEIAALDLQAELLARLNG